MFDEIIKRFEVPRKGRKGLARHSLSKGGELATNGQKNKFQKYFHIFFHRKRKLSRIR
jgi:hypothetical protein